MNHTITKLPIYDLYQAAFCAYKGIEPTLGETSGRVVFEFPPDERTYSALAEYQAGPRVPILDYVSHLRRLRSLMLQARSSRS